MATLLRAEGLRLTTLAEHYGIPEDEDVTDVQWLALAGQQGWAVFNERRPDPVQPSGA